MKVSSDFWQNREVFITGHTGFKGAWMCMVLKQLGAKITGFSLPAPSTPSMFELLNIADGIEHIKGDIRDREAISAAIKKANPKTIIHMAAQSLVRKSYHDPLETFDTNVTGTLNVLHAARDVAALESLLIITTDKCYRNDETGKFFEESDPLGGKDPYSASKACAEIVSGSYAESFFANSKTVVATARAGNVIGGGDWAEDRLIPDVVRSIALQQPIAVRNPAATRPWQHVLEPIFGYLSLVEKGVSGGWNFGPNPSDIKPVGAVLDVLSKSLDFDVELDSATHPHEAKTLGLDIGKAKSQLGWQPKLSIENALDWTGKWYQTYFDKGDLGQMTNQQISDYMRLK